jgi:hypothetical protein
MGTSPRSRAPSARRWAGSWSETPPAPRRGSSEFCCTARRSGWAALSPGRTRKCGTRSRSMAPPEGSAQLALVYSSRHTGACSRRKGLGQSRSTGETAWTCGRIVGYIRCEPRQIPRAGAARGAKCELKPGVNCEVHFARSTSFPRDAVWMHANAAHIHEASPARTSPRSAVSRPSRIAALFSPSRPRLRPYKQMKSCRGDRSTTTPASHPVCRARERHRRVPARSRAREVPVRCRKRIRAPDIHSSSSSPRQLARAQHLYPPPAAVSLSNNVRQKLGRGV